MSRSRAPATAAEHAAFHAPHNPWLIAVVATIATFMEVLDTSIANVSLPHIAGNLGASVTDSTWVLTSYLLANAIVLPATAWLSSAIGRTNYYMLSVALFSAASLLCGVAPNLGLLVACRVLQGLAGGGLQPMTQAIMIDTFPPHQRGMGMAVYGMTVVVAPVVGPTLGGWITDNYSWRWVFLINVPIGIVALWLSARYLSDPPFLRRRTGQSRWRVDFAGLSLLAIGLGAMQLVLDLGEREDWFASPWIQGAAWLAVITLLGGIWWAFRHPDPIVNLRVLRDRNLGLSCLHMLVFGAVLFASTALLPLMMQTLLGYTAQLSGMALSPGGMVIAVMMPLVGWLVTRVDARWMVLTGIVIIAVALLQFAALSLTVDLRTLVLVRMLQGLGLAFVFVPINTIAYASISPAARNDASSLMSIARNIGGSIGIAYAGTMVARGGQTHRAQLVEHCSIYDPHYQAAAAAVRDRLLAGGADPAPAELVSHAVLDQLVNRQASMLSYLDQFRFQALAFLVLVPIVLLMRRRTAPTHVELVGE
ncbi:MAG TPA: DHA2 family efflux MFS transporter permease subunit [Planctomycetota bacterium]|nr:DHA2 family efflux MFS transporter permease subunit [Planctomycetota bacterium]